MPLPEGVVLAESEKFQSAVGRWNQAIECTPDRHTLHEMKAQALLEIGENFQAIQSASRATQLQPMWPPGWMTLARGQMALGELDLALSTFQHVLALADLPPDAAEETTEDIAFVHKLIRSRDALLQGDAAHSALYRRAIGIDANAAARQG
eukprot:m.504074 g.504074  ORF g.504074 m.504074 type:complete len:151 (-) comp21855_c0_seq7:2456-2908(-)